MSAELRAELHRAVQVRLTTDKSIYDAGEEPILAMQVVNVGTLPFYVYPNTRLGYDGDGVFRVYVQGSCLMYGYGEAIDYAPKDLNANLAAYIEKIWLLLKPGESLRLTQKLEASRVSLCPGKNTIRVNYFTKLQPWSVQQIRASESELKYPAAYGSYDGNTVIVTVRSGH